METQILYYLGASIILYLLSFAYLIYLINKKFPDFLKLIYPFGIMNTGATKFVPFSENFFKAGMKTIKGHAQLVKILFTTKFSENSQIRSIKNLVRLLLLIAVFMIVFTAVNFLSLAN